jgi:tetratricopeptide (TPR) repeat protein
MAIQRILSFFVTQNAAQEPFLQAQLLSADGREFLDAVDNIHLPQDGDRLLPDLLVGEFLHQFFNCEPQLLYDAAKAYGNRLYQALFAGDTLLGRAWQQACDLARYEGMRLEIRIDLRNHNGEPVRWGIWPLAMIPFELLHNGNDFVFRRPRWHSVRTVRNQSTRMPRIRVPGALPGVLLGCANVCLLGSDQRLPESDFLTHAEALRQLANKRQIRYMAPLTAATRAQLRDTMKELQPEVLIWVGHGDPKGSALTVHDASNRAYPVDYGIPMQAGDFAKLARSGNVELAFLWSCYGAGAHHALDPGVAEALLNPDQGDLLAVVASYSALESAEIAQFSKEILDAWAVGEEGDLEQALAVARDSLPEQSLTWARPILFSRAQRGKPVWQLGQPDKVLELAASNGNYDPRHWFPPPPLASPHFLGRNDFLRRADQELQDYSVLVLAGVAGVGKTEVAVAVARQWCANGRDVAFVDASIFADVSDLVAHMGQWRGLERVENETVLFEAYRAFPLLLVIDNAENILITNGMRQHLLHLLQGLRSVAPTQFRCLITSRRSLWGQGDVARNWVAMLEVPPLPPDVACALFIASAGPRLPKSQLNQLELVDVLMFELGGLARAIVLMASQLRDTVDVHELIRRIKVQGLEAVVVDEFFGEVIPAKLDKKFAKERLLSSLNLTLAAAETENPHATWLFDLMGAFPGGLAQEALPFTEHPWLQDAQAVLLQHNLLSLNGPARRLYQAVPLFSLASAHLQKRAENHLLWPVLGMVYRHLADKAMFMHGKIGTESSVIALRWFLLEESNLRIGLSNLAQEGSMASAGAVQDIIFCLTNAFLHAGRAKEGLDRLCEPVLGILNRWPDSCVAAVAQLSLGDMRLHIADLSGARQEYEAALILFQARGEQLWQANTLQALGDIKIRLGDRIGAQQDFREALSLYQAIDERLGQANAFKALGDLAMREADLLSAEQSYCTALALFRDVDPFLGQANTLKALGDLMLRKHDLVGARLKYDAASAIFQTIGARHGQANTLQVLGLLDLLEDMLPEAFSKLCRALSEQQALNNQLGVAACHCYLARVAKKAQQTKQALALNVRTLLILQAIDDRYGQKAVYYDLGELLQIENAFLSSASFYLAWQIAQDMGDPDAPSLEAILGASLKHSSPESALAHDFPACAQSSLDNYLTEIAEKIKKGEIDLYIPPPGAANVI